MSRYLDIQGWVALVGGLVLIVVGGLLGRGLEAAAPERGDEVELALFPHGEWVRLAALGRNELAADMVWLRAIQYYGEHRMTDLSYPYAETLFGTLTDLDPHFVNAYIFGALILNEHHGKIAPSLELLDKGIEANPDSWWLAFERGFFLYVTHTDLEEASRWLRRASEIEGAPDWVHRIAAFSAQRAGDPVVAQALWLEMFHHTENVEMKRVAWDYLQELGHPDFQKANPFATDDLPEGQEEGVL